MGNICMSMEATFMRCIIRSEGNDPATQDTAHAGPARPAFSSRRIGSSRSSKALPMLAPRSPVSRCGRRDQTEHSRPSVVREDVPHLAISSSAADVHFPANGPSAAAVAAWPPSLSDVSPRLLGSSVITTMGNPAC